MQIPTYFLVNPSRLALERERSEGTGKSQGTTRNIKSCPNRNSIACITRIACPEFILTTVHIRGDGMESSDAALEHRVTELESLVGERPADATENPECVCCALREAAQATVNAICPDRPERAMATLRRAQFVREHRVSRAGFSAVVVEDAKQRISSLERALSDLSVLTPILDRDWDKDIVDMKRVQDAAEKAGIAADAAEEVVEQESRAVDDLLNDYNSFIKGMNAHFLRLEGMVQALEQMPAQKPEST